MKAQLAVEPLKSWETEHLEMISGIRSPRPHTVEYIVVVPGFGALIAVVDDLLAPRLEIHSDIGSPFEVVDDRYYELLL
jgi:hypothetical protein